MKMQTVKKVMAEMGRKGGAARKANLSPEELSAQGRKAAAASAKARTAKVKARAKLNERIMGDLSDAVVDSLNAPKCDDCGTEMSRYYEAADTGANGWRCDDCGWTWDDAPPVGDGPKPKPMKMPEALWNLRVVANQWLLEHPDNPEAPAIRKALERTKDLV